jgi:outer membrane protein OmpA-like peptidoglycan-associated protein
MNKYPNMVVELGSHTDCRASIKYNETLSDKRAKASAAYIKTKITNPARIYGKGYGESVLLNGCACEGTVKSTCSEEEHQKNRRTEFKIISMGAGTDKVDVINNSTNSFDKKTKK